MIDDLLSIQNSKFLILYSMAEVLEARLLLRCCIWYLTF